MGVLSGIAASVAAVAVVAGGVTFELHHHGPAGVHPSGYTTASNQATNQTGTNQTGTNQAGTNEAQNTNSVQPDNSTTPSDTAASGVQVQTYSTNSTAAAVIDQLQQKIGQVYPSGPPVDLGTGIKANFNGGAGTYVYQWHEGNWTLNVQGVGDSTPGTQVAKNVVSYLHTHMLPAPHNKGTIIISEASGGSTWNTTMAWQEGTKVYQLQQSGAPVSALTVAVNYNSPSNSGNQGFSQTFRSTGQSSQVFLTPFLGFEITNLGGGANNFQYQFSKTTDGGKTWTKVSTARFSHVNGVSFINSNTGYLLNNSPAYAITPDLFVTHDGGATWKEQKLPIPSPYTNDYRSSSYPIFFSSKVGFIPVYGMSQSGSTTQKFLYMLATTDGGTSWTAYKTGQGAGLSWTVSGQKLTVTNGTKVITVNGLLQGNWAVSTATK